ncbi:hypothetical protein BU16DRAFT_445282, partial [Lophium mytilinum]
ILLLNAFPGTGKLTIAPLLAAPSILLHNHLLVDPAAAIYPERDQNHYALRRAFRKTAFDALKADNRDLSIIMAACLGNSAADVAVLAEYVDVARVRNVPFILVNLVCDMDEHVARLQGRERGEGARTKLRDGEVLRELMAGNTLVRAREHRELWEGVEVRTYEMDTTGREAGEVAGK